MVSRIAAFEANPTAEHFTALQEARCALSDSLGTVIESREKYMKASKKHHSAQIVRLTMEVKSKMTSKGHELGSRFCELIQIVEPFLGNKENAAT
jgi:hypothetical protein